MQSFDFEELKNQLIKDKNNLINLTNKLLTTSQDCQRAEKESEELSIKIRETAANVENIKSTLHAKKTKNEELKAKLAELRNEIETGELKCKNLSDSLKVGNSDKMRLQQAKELLDIGKDFTGIRWDYSAPDNIVKGYIVNKDAKILETIEINKSEMTEEKLQIELWNKIQSTSTVDWSDLVAKVDPSKRIMNKENVANN